MAPLRPRAQDFWAPRALPCPTGQLLWLGEAAEADSLPVPSRHLLLLLTLCAVSVCGRHPRAPAAGRAAPAPATDKRCKQEQQRQPRGRAHPTTESTEAPAKTASPRAAVRAEGEGVMATTPTGATARISASWSCKSTEGDAQPQRWLRRNGRPPPLSQRPLSISIVSKFSSVSQSVSQMLSPCNFYLVFFSISQPCFARSAHNRIIIRARTELRIVRHRRDAG